MEIIVINKLMVCLTILAPLFTECRVIVLWVRLCFCTYTPQSWKPFNIPVFVCAEKNRVNCFSQATDKWHRWRCSAQDLCLKKMWTNLNPVNESEEFISNWRIQKSKDNGSDIIAQPRSTSFLTFCQFRWTFTGSSELAWAAKNYCQNAITVHDTTGPSWKPTKLKARNENVKEVSDEQHSLVWFWCATLIITWKELEECRCCNFPKSEGNCVLSF